MNIKDYEDYKIFDDGRVFSNKRNRLLKGCKDTKGYMMVGLMKNGKEKKYKIHRLVAEHYIPNLNNYPQVDHINRIKNDNRVENLRWVTNTLNQHNTDVRKINKLKQKNIFKVHSKRYRIAIKRFGLRYIKDRKTLEEAIIQRDIMLSMWI
jgi:hypothetical protein